MAIDALQFKNFFEQFRPEKINRELNKVILYFSFNLYFLFMSQNEENWVVPFGRVLGSGLD